MLRILQSQAAIRESRCRLDKLGASQVEGSFRTTLRRLRLLRGDVVGDRLKSWDLLQSIEYLQQNVAIDASILDVGCYCSEMLPSLRALGFQQLVGVDLNSALHKMPYATEIRYINQDYLRTSFPDASFNVITSVSVMEHGFQQEPMLLEVSRLLRPGGTFLTSFDYWPEKIATDDTKFFGMRWTIFSSDEIRGLVGAAGSYGLEPIGPLEFGAVAAPIRCAGRRYTFGWLALKKRG